MGDLPPAGPRGARGRRRVPSSGPRRGRISGHFYTSKIKITPKQTSRRYSAQLKLCAGDTLLEVCGARASAFGLAHTPLIPSSSGGRRGVANATYDLLTLILLDKRSVSHPQTRGACPSVILSEPAYLSFFIYLLNIHEPDRHLDCACGKLSDRHIDRHHLKVGGSLSGFVDFI